MRSFPAGFITEIAKAASAPVWILKLTVGGLDYYLSDNTYSIATWNGGITTKAWVKSWGQVSEALGGNLNEIRISDFSAAFLIDPAASPNMETLATATDLERSVATLYLWFHGLNPATDPPQPIWSGFVTGVEIPTPTTVALSFEDGSNRLAADCGTVITTAAYPIADPDDVGKILPIVFGSVDRIPTPALVAGRCTTLTAAVTTITQTSFAVLDATGLAINNYLTIDTEEVKITAITGLTLTVTRGQNGTTKATYPIGQPLFQVMSTTPFVFAAADQPVTAIDRVRVSRNGIDVDITDLVSRFTGQIGSQYTGFTGNAVIVITTSSARLIRARLEAALRDSDLSLINGTHTHANNTQSTVVQNATAPVTQTGGSYLTFYPTFPAAPGAILSGTYHFHFIYSISGSNLGSATIKWNGPYGPDALSQQDFTWQSAQIPTLYVTASGATSCSLTLQAGSNRTITYTVAIDPATVSLSGGVNSTADNEIGGMILADVTVTQTLPLDVINAILGRTPTGITAALVGTYPAGYAINGAVLRPQPFIDLLNQIAFEARSWFKLAATTAKLTVRPDTLTSARTLAVCAADNNGLRLHSRRKTDLDDALNTIVLRYGRDWTMEGDEAYTLTSTASDATSITDYGVREQPDLFRCDFITTPAMADSVRDYYLARYKRRHWQHAFEVDLDQAAIEFGDILTLGFSANAVGEVVEARFSPGSSTQFDSIELVVEV